MANQKVREKRREARLRKSQVKQLEKQKVEELLDEEDEVLDIEADEPADDEELDETDSEVPQDASPAKIGKSYDEPMMYFGPTSWQEADAMRDARKRAEAVRETTWTAEELVRNIIQRPDMDPDEKGKAIASVGTGFGQRVKTITSEKMKKSLDMDLLELQSIIAIDQRHTPISEKVGDWLTKTVRGHGELEDKDYAIVYEAEGKKVRKYPIHDKAHVRKALSRAVEMIEDGGPAEEEARKALPSIRAAAKNFGIGMEKENAIIVEKDASGDWRAVLWPTNNFKDRDGEIIADSAHAEYVEWVNKNMELAPLFMSWHIPGTARSSPIDFVGYENGFVIASAPLTEGEAAAILKMQTQVDLGLSIGGFALERSPDDKKVITKYRMYEVSDLPLERAANPFTEFNVFTKEADVDTLQYLTGILGDEEKAKSYIEKAGIKQQELRKAGVAEKEVTETPETPEAEAPAAQPVQLDEVLARVEKEFGMTQLSEQFAALMEKAEKVDVLEALVKELAASNDEKLAEMISPPASKSFSWMEKRASQSDATLLKEENEEDKNLKKSHPEYWLSEATNTQPVQTQ